ncbi:glycosyl transferase [Palleronia sediminis]|uniref:Glycosyl transferase n=1 Tax=Palleronia sediminis TaxID=2547833 RepID=A0A4R6AIG9_9RHOB|nr:glycosyltransferase [Palleronia sediminis]TDL81466.1 glycosyl transferase [Palleronia sediminis]
MLPKDVNPDRRAYVTLVTADSYLPGARALVNSLKLSGTAADIVVMHDPGIDLAGLDDLATRGARLVPVELPRLSREFHELHERGNLHGRAPFSKGNKPAFHVPLHNFAKLRLWQLDYDALVYIDADAIVLRNCDRLFSYPQFCAAPNLYESLVDFGRLNSGVFTARPDPAIYEDMLRVLDRPGKFWRRTDQTFLEEYFPDWHGLPIYYNMMQYVWLNLPEIWRWQDIRIVHFQYEKPWDTPHDKSSRLLPLIELWRAFERGHDIPDLSTLPPPP